MAIYLDHNATTPLDPAVLEAMLPYLRDEFGNASSVHSAGQRARAAVDEARESVAALISAKPSEIVFTSGGTEADNLAILGAVRASNPPNKHIVTTLIEHHAVLQTCQALEKEGVEVSYIAPNPSGAISPASIARAICPETLLISVMHANNELGTIQPVEEIGRIAREAKILFHVDAVQSASKLPIDVRAIGADLLSLSAHKIYGPKGIGALYIRSGSRIEPVFRGQHERGLRPGTENVASIVGMGKAAELARQHLAEDAVRIATMRDHFESAICEAVEGIRANGDPLSRVCNTANITVPGASGESLVIALDLQGIACSTGAACSSGAIEPSHVLLAIGLTDEDARSSIRFSLGRTTTQAEIEHAIAAIPGVVARLRALSPKFSPMSPVAAGRAN